jgi:hypothetical protein
VIVDLPLGAGQLLDEEEGEGVVAAVVVDVGAANLVRQAGDPVQAGDDVELGPLHVGAEGKLQVDFGEAGEAVAGEVLEPLHPCISCSMGSVISDSISWGEAERQSTEMLRCGRSMSGNSWIGSPRMLSRPSRKISTIETATQMGRSIAVLARFIHSS